MNFKKADQIHKKTKKQGNVVMQLPITTLMSKNVCGYEQITRKQNCIAVNKPNPLKKI